MSYGHLDIKTWKGRQLGLMTEKTCKFLKKSRNRSRRIEGRTTIADQMNDHGDVVWLIIGGRVEVRDKELHDEEMRQAAYDDMFMQREAEIEFELELLRECQCSLCRYDSSFEEALTMADEIINDWPDDYYPDYWDN